MSYDEIMHLALGRGFIFPSCEIYSDAVAGFWDYGPLGTRLKYRFIDLWRKELVRRDQMLEIDGSQIMSKAVFEASGHLENFVDPIVSCDSCKLSVRVDKLISDNSNDVVPERLSEKKYHELLKKHNIKCPKCKKDFGKVSKFNMMFRVGIGDTDENAYLRPETCQSIFVDFPRLFKIMRGKLPFSVAQTGKSFRNEISPRQSLMRLREFYQAEIEIFFNASKTDDFEKFEEIRNYNLRIMINEKINDISCEDAIKKNIIPNKLMVYYLALMQQFFEKAGIDLNKLRFRKLNDDDKAFYAKSAFDLEVKTSLGWIELVACNDRGNYDLMRHSEVSKKDMMVMDENEKVLPNIFELSMGIDRSIYCIMEHSFVKEKERNILKLNRSLAPIQVGIFPLSKKESIPVIAKKIQNTLKGEFETFYDESGSIGRRYRRLDEIGTPLGVTVDYDTLKDNTVTLRNRDDMKQIRVNINKLHSIIRRYYHNEDVFLDNKPNQ